MSLGQQALVCTHQGEAVAMGYGQVQAIAGPQAEVPFLDDPTPRSEAVELFSLGARLRPRLLHLDVSSWHLAGMSTKNRFP